MRQYDRAIRELDHAINVKPDYAPAFNVRGLAYAAIGETRRSIQDFDQAIQLDGSFAKAFVNRGNIYQSTHRYDRALADYSAAVQLNPKDAYSLYSRGLTMRVAGQGGGGEGGYRQGQGDRAGHRALIDARRRCRRVIS